MKNTCLSFPDGNVRWLDMPYCPAINSLMIVPDEERMHVTYRVAVVETNLSFRNENDSSLVHHFTMVYLEDEEDSSKTQEK